jgi:multicomponent Na+:H+ antiporter subunit B
MNSVILQTSARFLATLLLLASVFLLWRGHNDPGGGFAGGLMAAAAFALIAIATTTAESRRVMRCPPPLFIAAGLAIATLAAMIGPLTGGAFFEGRWQEVDLPGGAPVKLGSPLLFDVGVYLVVVGVVTSILFALMEEEEA